MEKDVRYIGLRVSNATHYKLTYICDHYERTIASFCSYLIKRQIASFEKKYGEIELPAYIKDEK